MRDATSNISPRPSSLSTLLRKALFVAVWAALVLACFGVLTRYEITTGAKGHVGRLPDGLKPAGPEKLLLIALHPHCPCSEASVDELVQIYSRAQGRMKVTALVFKPAEEPDDWIETDSMKALEPMHPRIVIDTNGVVAAQMGLATSGQVRLYSPKAELLYNGGITGGRGHRGDNEGERAVLQLVRGEAKTARCTPAFGCSLKNP